ncbi:DNA polymerase III [Deinococcus radiophilus]|uniref:DNA polymerase III n=1 Tax=Deinococcus radiophilus TaxID=32062 RepID=A0A3S0L7W4_9DEIO|nr:DNA polymerase III [Deinococcus radiophilus]RTR28998.1 DNA polymerase III [Deinococcus radiophilus]UFA49581.1 DNA polymerase III [Deinococcus radiophilus]
MLPTLPQAHLPLLEQATAARGNALLLTGAEYGGQRALALAVFAALNCTGQRGMGGEACGVCPSCRGLAAGAHPDLLELSPRETTGTGRAARRRIIPVGAVVQSRDDRREYDTHVLEFLEVRPTYARRAVLIRGAEFLGPEAANALLKLIEEPPHGARFLLLAADVRAVIPTIVSRSTRLSVPPLSDAAMHEELARRSGPDDLDPDELVALAAGRPEVLDHAAEVGTALGQAAGFHMALREGMLPTLDAAAELESHWTPWHAEALRSVWRAEPAPARAGLDTALAALERALEAYANPALSFMVFGLAARAALGVDRA